MQEAVKRILKNFHYWLRHTIDRLMPSNAKPILDGVNLLGFVGLTHIFFRLLHLWIA